MKYLFFLQLFLVGVNSYLWLAKDLNGTNGFNVSAGIYNPSLSFGAQVECCDFNKDNRSDCAFFATGNSKIYILFGADTFSPHINMTANGFVIDVGPILRFASGDINDDGYCDLVFSKSAAVVQIMFGRDFSSPPLNGSSVSLNNLTNVASFSGTTSTQFGSSIAVGDVNGDRYADLLIGDPLSDSNKGSLYIIFGRNDTTKFPNISSVSDEQSNGAVKIIGDYYQFGRNIQVGNINGDNMTDIILTDLQTNIYIIYGSTYFSSLNISNMGVNGVKYPYSISLGLVVGDVNGDGFDDIAIVSPSRMYIAYSAGATVDITANKSEISPGAASFASVTIWDYNRDGHGDFVCATTGGGYVVYGNLSYPFDIPQNSIPIRQENGFKIEELGGGTLIDVADVNGDGSTDLIVASPNSYYGSDSGVGWILLGINAPEKPIASVTTSAPRPPSSDSTVGNGTIIPSLTVAEGSYDAGGSTVAEALSSNCSYSNISQCTQGILFLRADDFGKFLGYFDFDTRTISARSSWKFSIIVGTKVPLTSPWNFNFVFKDDTLGESAFTIDTIEPNKFVTKSFEFPKEFDQYSRNGIVRVQSASTKNKRQNSDPELAVDSFSLNYQVGEENLESPNKKLLNGAAIAGIVIVVILLVLAIAGATFFILVNKKIFLHMHRRRNIPTLREELELEIEEDEDGLLLISDVTIGMRLGSGAFGEVFKGRWREADVAVKQIKDKFSKEFVEEARLLQKLVHPNTVLFLGVYVDGDRNRYLVTEFCEGGSLIDLLKKKHKKGIKLKNKQILDYAHEAAKGMAFLEGKKVIHRDLAARNLLVTKNGIVKVADFGLSRDNGSDTYESQSKGPVPVRWTAPEAIQHRKYSNKSDSWSMGITLYELYTRGELPYSGMNNMKVIDQVCNHGHRLESIVDSENCPKEMWELMTDCWKENPEDRPTLAEICSRIEQIKKSYVEEDSSSDDEDTGKEEKNKKSNGEQAETYSSTKQSVYENDPKPEDDYQVSPAEVCLVVQKNDSADEKKPSDEKIEVKTEKDKDSSSSSSSSSSSEDESSAQIHTYSESADEAYQLV